MTPATPPRIDLPTWDAEGGALPGVAVPPAAAAPEIATDDELLLRLGAALVHEWNTLPMPTRRAIYDRAVSGPAPAEDAALKRDMAVFLHDNKSPGPHS
jgi:hypothetical protein